MIKKDEILEIDFSPEIESLSYFAHIPYTPMSAIAEISYKVDLSKKKSLESLSKDKFTSYLYIPN